MTVLHTGGKTWRQGNRPDWTRTPSAGFYSLAREGTIGDYRVKVVDVSPEPVSTHAIKPDEYRVTIKVQHS